MEVGHEVAIRLLSCIILVAVDLHPTVHDPLSGPLIVVAVFRLDQVATGQNTVRKGVVVTGDGLFSIHRFSGSGIEIIILIHAADRNHAPTGHQVPVDRVIQFTFDFEQSGHLALAHTIFVEAIYTGHGFILIAGHDLNAGHRDVISVIVKIVASGPPSLPDGLVQSKGVIESLVGRGEVAALLALIIGIHIGINAVGLLCGSLACHVVEGAGAQVNVVAQITGICNRQAVVFVPGSVSFGSCLDSTENTDGVCCVRFNRSSLLLPVEGDGERAGLCVKLRTGQREVLIDQGQF